MVHNLQHYYAVFLKCFSLNGCGQGCAALSFAYLPKDQCGGFMNMSAVIHLPLCFPIHAFVFIFSYPFISLKEFLSFLCWCPCAMSLHFLFIYFFECFITFYSVLNGKKVKL